MDVHLTRDQEAFIQDAIDSGRFQHPEDALREALSLWERRERTRAEILAAVDRAESSLARGEGRKISPDSLRQLAQEVKERGRSQFDAENTSSR
jgi:Arc/MetJ-type ribon-helix-helix transcriptional regulator